MAGRTYRIEQNSNKRLSLKIPRTFRRRRVPPHATEAARKAKVRLVLAAEIRARSLTNRRRQEKKEKLGQKSCKPSGRKHLLSAEKARREDVSIPGQVQCPAKVPNMFRLSHSKNADQAVEVLQASHRRRAD